MRPAFFFLPNVVVFRKYYSLFAIAEPPVRTDKKTLTFIIQCKLSLIENHTIYLKWNPESDNTNSRVICIVFLPWG